jgi:hypothetical protein
MTAMKALLRMQAVAPRPRYPLAKVPRVTLIEVRIY